MRSMRFAGLALFVALAALMNLPAGTALAATTERVSVNSAEAEATGGGNFAPSFSNDGRFVVFESSATNLAAGDTNALSDIFVRDRALGTTERVNIDNGGAQTVGGGSGAAAISGDGRFVAFGSGATNLVAGDTNGFGDIFVRDRALGTTERVSVDSAATQAAGGLSSGSAISGDGRFVAFYSSATNLVAGDTNGLFDIFVRDRALGTTERVSVDSGEAQAAGGVSFVPSLSNDGRFVAFYSSATNLAAGDTNGASDIFVRDRALGTTERVSVDSTEAQATDGSVEAAISGDGRFVAYQSNATNLVAGDTNGSGDTFIRDRTLGTTERVSVDSAEAQAAGGGSGAPAISGDGRFVTFPSDATNLVAGDTNARSDIFVRDRAVGTTQRVSVDSAGAQAAEGSFAPAISGDGRFVAFESFAANLVLNDSNLERDILVRALADPGDQPGTTERVSVDSAEAQAAGGVSAYVSISGDGRYVAFTSAATNLVAGDTNGFDDIFVRDRSLGTTERVSVDSAEAQAAGGASFLPAVSGDGRFVAFESDATNLVPGDTNGTYDIFVRDRALGTTERVSVDSAEAQAGGNSESPAISGDGRFVVFYSRATNLVAGDTNGVADVFVRDRALGTTERASVDSAEVQATGGDSFLPAISADGRFVAFASFATNLVTGDGNGFSDVFVRDRSLGTTERASVDSAEVQAAGGNSFDPSISGDGRFVALFSYATNLVAGDTNGVADVFVRDRSLGTTERVSVDSGEAQAAGDSIGLAINGDGRFVAFGSSATNLVAGDTNGFADIFVRDRTLGTTERVSVDSGEAQPAGGGLCCVPSISNDGRFVAFQSYATNLVAGDTNALGDIFVRSFDEDNDLLHQSEDNCPATANGPGQAAVLGVGHQTDSDGDGIPGFLPPPGASFGGDACDVDDDNDGVPDSADAFCRTAPEDYDGFEDGDGCPDPDNDLDGICDSGQTSVSCTGSDSGKYCFDPAATLACHAAPASDCRNVAEDYDNFKDSDGCPEPDNDNDGFQDFADNCPGSAAATGADGMLGSPQDLNHNGVQNGAEGTLTSDDVVLTFEDYDLVLDGDGCHDSPGEDFDGDGYTDDDEALKIGTNPGYPCGINGWPSNLNDSGGANRLDILDVTSFVAPVRHFEKSPGDFGFDARWDIRPGDGGLPPKYINILDVTTLVAGPTGNPPMLNGARAFGKDCPLAP